MVVWSQIFSTIQGSTISHKCPNSYISEDTYIRISKNRFIGEQEKREIYAIFLRYSSWKSIIHKFDQTDLVNHLLRKIQRNSYLGPKINYLFIDEVQDLTPATIYLVSQTVSNNIFYTGDTAQSISKGVIFKFSDIKLLYKSEESTETIDKQEPQIMQLTVNFRSHNNILRVANCLIKVIEVLFPKAIDKLRKERSKIDGPKPIVVQNSEQILKIFQFRLHNNKVRLNCRQAVIVRRKQNKREVQKLFPGAIVLTIAECKGLQYEDIILWKLFEQKFELLWKIIDLIEIREQFEDKEGKIDVEQGSKYDQIEDILGKSSKLRQVNINDYYQLCSELKLLYTAVTRAKQILIFYQSVPDRLLKKFDQLDLIERFSLSAASRIKQYKQYKSGINKVDERKSKQQVKKIQDEQWRISGMQFYKKKNYKQARICFENIGEERMCKFMDIKIHLREANKIEEDIKIRKILTPEFSTKYLQAKKNEELKKAASISVQINRLKQAGKIYFQAQSYQEAYNCFAKQNMFYEMGRCKQEMNDNIEAAKLFESCGSYQKMLTCFDNDKKYLLAMVKMKQHENNINELQKRRQETKKRIIKQISSRFGGDFDESIYKIQHYSKIDNVNVNMSMNQQIIVPFLLNKQIDQLSFSTLYQNRIAKVTNSRAYSKRKQTRKGKVLKTILKQTKVLPITSIRIAFIFQDNLFSCFLPDYLRVPPNIKQLIKKLENLGELKLCLTLSDLYNQYEHFQDYYTVFLYENYPKPDNFDKNLFLSSSNQTKQQTISIGFQLSLLNYESLLQIQKTIKPRIVNNLIVNLVLCGFYRDCEIFFSNKQQFYSSFLLNSQLFKLLHKKFGYQATNNNSVSQKINFMKRSDWQKNLTEKQVIFSLRQLFNLQINKEKKIRWLQFNLYKQLKRIKFRMKKLNEQEEKAEKRHIEKGNSLAQQQKKKKKQLQKLQQEEQEWKQKNNKCYKDYIANDFTRKDEDEYLQRLLKNEKDLHEIEDVDEKFMYVQNQIIVNNVRLSINKNDQQSIKVDLKNIKQQIECQLKSHYSAMKQNDETYNFKKDQLKEIEKLIKEFQNGGGYYPPNYNSRFVWKDLIQEIKAIQFFENITLRQCSSFLHTLFGNSSFQEKQLFSILNFDLYQQSYIKICEISIVALSILFQHLNLISQIIYFRSNQRTQNLIIFGIRNFFLNIIKLLEDEDIHQNHKFVQIILQFLQIRLFKNIQGFEILHGYAIMSSQMQKQISFIAQQDVAYYTYLDQNKTLLVTKEKQIKQTTIKYIKRCYWYIFRQNLIHNSQNICHSICNLSQQIGKKEAVDKQKKVSQKIKNQKNEIISEQMQNKIQVQSQQKNASQKNKEDEVVKEQKKEGAGNQELEQQQQQQKRRVIILQKQQKFIEELNENQQDESQIKDGQQFNEEQQQQVVESTSQQQQMQIQRQSFMHQQNSESEDCLNLNILKIQRLIQEENQKRLELVKIILFRKSGRKFKLHLIKKHIRDACDNSTIMFYLLRSLKDTQQNLRLLKIQKQLNKKSAEILKQRKHNNIQALKILQKEREAIKQKLKMEHLQNASTRIIQKEEQSQSIINWCEHCNERQVENEVAGSEKIGQLNMFCNVCIQQFGSNEDRAKKDVYDRFGFEVVYDQKQEK